MGMVSYLLHPPPKRHKAQYRAAELQRENDGYFKVDSLSANMRASLEEDGTDLHTYHTPTDVTGNAPSHPQIFMMISFAPTNNEFLLTHTLTM